MRFAFVMDPIDRVKVDADTTFALLLAAQERGHECFYVRPVDLWAEGGEARAIAFPVTVRRDAAHPAELGAPIDAALADMSAVLLREDPPFDSAYLYTTQIAELARGKTLVVNDPRGLRDANEKLYALHFPEIVPPTIVTRDTARILAFARAHGGAVGKPLDGAGGAGVVLVTPADPNHRALLEILTDGERRLAMAQRYLPEVRAGDKRILLLDGQALGAIVRVPRDDELRSNIHVGGEVRKGVLDEADRAICEAIGPRLRADGLFFVGIDVIGGRLTEVNVTSPTGIQEMSRLDGVDYAGRVVAWLEARAR
jgi:glutathione synthase